MLDQSFSLENFRRILDYENRKGIYLEGRYFLELDEITSKIKTYTFEIKEKKKNATQEEFEEFRKVTNAKIDQLKEAKENKLNIELQKISKNVVNNKFKITLEKNDTIADKPVYITIDNPENFFALKQIQYNFRKLYKVKQSSRFAIVSQVKTLLSDNFPKYIIRTDIKDFYESIPQIDLIKKLNEENLLTFYSKKLISQILKEYKRLSHSEKGVPRGIGVSAYLVELYMRDIDNLIKALPDVIYYARYVDDIIVIFTPGTVVGDRKYLESIDEIIETKFSLTRNRDKTTIFDHTAASALSSFEYLGYKINFGADSVKLTLTNKKIERYKKRIDSALNSYCAHFSIDEKKARKSLVKRIKFLTGNTRLLNNKKNILVGVFYSNSLLTHASDFVGLDSYLAHKINTQITLPQLKTRLNKYKFQEGFLQKRFSAFTTKDLLQILEIW